jgi:zinc protease
MLTEVQLEGLEQDFFDRRNAYMNAVTLDDVKRVAARLLHPDRLIFVIVGSPAGL